MYYNMGGFAQGVSELLESKFRGVRITSLPQRSLAAKLCAEGEHFPFLQE